MRGNDPEGKRVLDSVLHAAHSRYGQTMPSTTTDQELDGLRADQLPDGALVWVTHFFTHIGSTYEEHAVFHAALRAASFGTPGRFIEIGVDEELTGDGCWHHGARTRLPAVPDRLREADARANEIAKAHGVRYDGWHVERVPQYPPLTGRPRLGEYEESPSSVARGGSRVGCASARE